jgi:hypothetical protein
MSIEYLAALPVEILHRIFNYLDIQTILFSLRSVCKRFYSITNSYNSYNFNFESISKTNFHLICRIIPFEQVISLTLSNKDITNGQIRLFLSLFNINHFIRLRSLNLIQIEDDDLKIFLNYITHSSLVSLSIDSQTLSIRKNTALNLLSLTIECHTLQKLDLNMWPKDMNELQWPINCTINYLRIRNSITLNQFYKILRYSPCLQTIILKDFNIDDTGENLSTYVDHTQFLQLKSLTCENGRIEMTKLEQCLSLIPGLIHLKLIGSGNLFNSSFDGYRWEELIKSKLPLLEKFEIFISVLTDVHFDTNNIEQIISFFRTSFWLEEKRWFVICDYIIHLHKLILYSIPICNSHFEYYSNVENVSAANFIRKDNDSIMMDHVKQLDMHLSKIMNDDKIENVNHFLFRNVNELVLGVDGEWGKDSVRFLSMTIDLSRLVKLSLSVNFSHEYMPSIVCGANELLKHAVNIHTLWLFDYWAPANCTANMETVCSMTTPNIKHLRIRVKNSDDIKFIIESLENLMSVTFQYTQGLIFISEEYINCLLDLKRHTSKWACRFALHVWLDHN